AHQDEATPHAVAGAAAGGARDGDGAAAHPRFLAWERAAELVAGIAADAHLAALHRRRRAMAGRPRDDEPAAAHGEPGISAGIAFYGDLAARHAAAHRVEHGERGAVAGNDEPRLGRALDPHREPVAERAGAIAVAQLDPLDLAGGK